MPLQTKGNEAANTGGAQSVLNAAAAANANEVLDSILPPTVKSYVELVKVQLNAGRQSSITHLYMHFEVFARLSSYSTAAEVCECWKIRLV